jgi:hypothetical protein
MSIEDAPPEVARATPRHRRLVIVLVAVAAVTVLGVAAGAVAAPLILNGSATDPAAAPAPLATAVVAAPRPTAPTTPTPTPTPSAKAEPAPPAAADEAPPAQAPDPSPPLPAPPAPVIPPLSFTSISAIPTNDFCNSRDGVTVSWVIAGALEDSVTVRVKSGGGTPIFDQTWTNLDPVDTYTFGNVDCLRPLWFFFISASDGTTTKKALLTFADGTDKGWSSN